MSDIPIDGLPAMEPAPDEEAWDAFLTWALERIGGNPENGLSNAQLAELEAAVDTQLPFEIGLLLIHGVPDDERWWRWDENPTDMLHRWNGDLLDGMLFDVEHNHAWLPSWGAEPGALDARLEVARQAFSDAPPLLPLYGHRAVPLTAARDEDSSDSNPVLSVMQTDIIVYGTDLAAWLHREFDVPLPMWPETPARWFPFWSELIEAGR